MKHFIITLWLSIISIGLMAQSNSLPAGTSSATPLGLRILNIGTPDTALRKMYLTWGANQSERIPKYSELSTASQGLTKTGKNITLGGDFTSDRVLTSRNNSLIKNYGNGIYTGAFIENYGQYSINYFGSSAVYLNMNGTSLGGRAIRLDGVNESDFGITEDAVNISRTKNNLVSNITISDSGIVVIDQIKNKGITGQLYYGANYTDNTYVQKKFVTDGIATAGADYAKLNVDNQFTKSQAYSLGEHGTFDIYSGLGDASAFNIGELSSALYSQGVDNGGNNVRSGIELYANSASYFGVDDFTNGTQRKLIYSSNGKNYFLDNKNNFGLEYQADYSVNGKLNDRWIPDWGSVKSSLANYLPYNGATGPIASSFGASFAGIAAVNPVNTGVGAGVFWKSKQSSTAFDWGAVSLLDSKTFRFSKAQANGGTIDTAIYDINYDTRVFTFASMPVIPGYLKKGGDTMTGDLILQSLTPTNALSAAPKGYIDNLLTGITWKNAVRVKTTTNITLSGTQTIDGIAVLIGNRILVGSQTNPAENGIYLVSSAAWSRVVDADQSSEIEQATVLVTVGTLNKNTQWTYIGTPNPVIGTDAIYFGQISGAGTYTNGPYLTLTGNVFDANLTTFDTRYKGTTLAFYGITDAYTKTQSDGNYVNLTTPQTVGGLKTFSSGFTTNADASVGGRFSIFRNVNDATAVLTVNQVNTSATGGIASFQLNNSEVARVSTTGILFGNGLNNIASSSNAAVSVSSSGTNISRNIADANTALTVNQVNPSSTGNIFVAQFASSNRFTVDLNGNSVLQGSSNVLGRLGIGISSGAGALIHINPPSFLTIGAFGTSGYGIRQEAITYNANGSSGTIASAYINSYGTATLASSSATTITKAYNTYISGISGSTNVTLGNGYSLGTQGDVEVGGNLLVFARAAIGKTTAAGSVLDVDQNNFATGNAFSNQGFGFRLGSSVATYTSNAAGGTQTFGTTATINGGIYAALNATTLTNAATLYIAGPPIAGTNVTITTPYSLYVGGGTGYFGAGLMVGAGGGSGTNRLSIGNSTLASSQLYIIGGQSTALPFGTTTAYGISQQNGVYNNTGPTASPALMAVNYIGIPQLTATNTQTVGVASTWYIEGSPTAGTNVTIATPYSLYIANGSAYVPTMVVNGSISTNTNNVYSTGSFAMLVRNGGSGRYETYDIFANANTFSGFNKFTSTSGIQAQALVIPNVTGTGVTTLSSLSTGNTNFSVQIKANVSGTLAFTSDIPTTLRLTASGTGSTTISVPHGLSGITSTSNVVASAETAAAGGWSYITKDATNINFIYTVAPPTAASNLIYNVQIKP